MIDFLNSKVSHLKNIYLRLNNLRPLGKYLTLTITLIILISFFYFWNINGGHDWGGDFSMYIMNAKNLLERSPYNQTGYIFNNEVVYGPSAFPPIFPLLLTPFIAIGGINLKILKIPGILCFFFFLLIFLNHIKNERNIHFPLRIILLVLLGLYPYFFYLSGRILSDLPFLFFCFFSLELMNKTIKFEEYSSKSLVYNFLTGFLIFIAYGTRTIGIILLPVYFLFSALKFRRLRLEIILSIIFSFLLMLILNKAIPQTGDYLDFLPNSFAGFISTTYNSFIYYFSLFFGLIQFDNFIIQSIIFIFLIELFAIGFVYKIKMGISSLEIFFIIYLGTLLFWPSYQFLRFLVPVIPLYFLYVFIGLEKLISFSRSPRLKIAIPILMVFFIGFSYINSYISIFPQPISDIEKVETQELFQFVTNNTTSDDVILFFKPRVLALFTERNSVAMAFPDGNGDEFAKMKEFGVTITILRKGHYLEYQPELENFINSHPNNFNLLFNNSEFIVYKVLY